tara:strand:+ start:2458 stop:4140 length:1683 start_codon:yes stop_codon:yes gene_type:complete
MLRLIQVKNYAVIDEVGLEFNPGLSVMTGETGAGKSIIVDALGLAIGDRADASAVRPGAERAEINVVFECDSDHPAISWLKDRGLDNEVSCFLRRIIYAEGRSRAFINNQPANQQDLREIGTLLVNIHGQATHHNLLRSSNQRTTLDYHGNHKKDSEKVADRFNAWQKLKCELDLKTKHRGDNEAKLELLNFQTQELKKLNLEEGEIELLTSEHSRLAHVDQLATALNKVLQGIYEGDEFSAHQFISTAHRTLEGLAQLDTSLSESAKQINEIEIELRETALELIRYRDNLEPNPQRLEWIENRLSIAKELATRHDIEPENLFRLCEDLESRINEIQVSCETLDELSKNVIEAEKLYFQLAEQLTQKRLLSAELLSQEVTDQMMELGLPHGSFRVLITKKTKEQADAHGLDQIEFQVVLNPGQKYGPLSKVASGGELSRVSLALEVVSAGAVGIPTLVFDEVDAGIGGGIAEIVGRRLSDVAHKSQVLCVTHLAQVASQGSHHFQIQKSTDGDTTRTNVLELDLNQRIEELSRMLGGVEITEKTRAHAAEMVQRAASPSN